MTYHPLVDIRTSETSALTHLFGARVKIGPGFLDAEAAFAVHLVYTARQSRGKAVSAVSFAGALNDKPLARSVPAGSAGQAAVGIFSDIYADGGELARAHDIGLRHTRICEE